MSVQKPLPAKYFKWLLKIIKVHRDGKGHISLLDQTTKGTLEARPSENTGSGRFSTIEARRLQCSEVAI